MVRFGAAACLAAGAQPVGQLARLAGTQLHPLAPYPHQRRLEASQGLQLGDGDLLVAEGGLPVEGDQPVLAEQAAAAAPGECVEACSRTPRREDGWRHQAGRSTPNPATSRAGATSTRSGGRPPCRPPAPWVRLGAGLMPVPGRRSGRGPVRRGALREELRARGPPFAGPPRSAIPHWLRRRGSGRPSPGGAARPASCRPLPQRPPGRHRPAAEARASGSTAATALPARRRLPATR